MFSKIPGYHEKVKYSETPLVLIYTLGPTSRLPSCPCLPSGPNVYPSHPQSEDPGTPVCYLVAIVINPPICPSSPPSTPLCHLIPIVISILDTYPKDIYTPWTLMPWTFTPRHSPTRTYTPWTDTP